MTSTVGQRLRQSLTFGRTAGAVSGPSHDQLYSELSARVGADVRQALLDSGEVQAEFAEEQLEATLLRYLRAESWSVEKAHKRLLQHVEWRLQTSPASIPLEEIQCHLDASKSLLHPGGQKRVPFLVAVARNHYPDGNNQQLERFVTYGLETASRACWDSPGLKMWILIDLNGLQLKNLDAAALRSCFSLLSNHYPERAAGIILYCAPVIFSGLWRVVSPFIHPDTRAKVHFLAAPAALELLEQEVGLDAVPKEYGGNAEAVPVQEAARMLKERAAGSAAGAAASAKAGAAKDGQVAASAEVAALAQSCRTCAGECRCDWAERQVEQVVAVA